MKYFSLILVLALVVAVSAYPSWEKRRGPGSGGGGSGGAGGKPGEQSGGPGSGSGGQQQQGQQKQGQQDQGGEGEQKPEGEGEKEVFGPRVTEECKAFLTELFEFRHAQKEAEDGEDEDDGEETRALHLIRELKLELLRRQEGPDETACMESFATRLADVDAACSADAEAEGCDVLERLNDASATVGSIVEALSGNTESAPPTAMMCYYIVSYPFRTEEEQNAEAEEPERRKRDAYGDMWGIYGSLNKLIGSCWEFYWGPHGDKGHGKEGEGEGQRQGEGEKKGDGQGPPPGGDGGEGPPPGEQDGGARRELLDYLLRKLDGKRRF